MLRCFLHSDVGVRNECSKSHWLPAACCMGLCVLLPGLAALHVGSGLSEDKVTPRTPPPAHVLPPG